MEAKKPGPNAEDATMAIVAVLEGGAPSDDPELDIAKVIMETLPEELSEGQKRRIAATATAMVMGGDV